MKWKAQVALEYLLVVGIVLSILLPTALYVYRENETLSGTYQAQVAASRLASVADNIYAQGPGAKATIGVTFPRGYSNLSTVYGNFINIKISTPSGYNDIIAVTKANITGSLPVSSGYKLITIEMLANGSVSIKAV